MGEVRLLAAAIVLTLMSASTAATAGPSQEQRPTLQMDSRLSFTSDRLGSTRAAAPADAGAEAALSTVDVLDLSRALEIVWTENPSVLEAAKQVEAAGYDVKGAYGGFLPSFTVNDDTGRNSVSSIQGSVPLFSGWLTLAQIDASKGKEIEARATLDKTRLTLAGDVLTAFYNQAQAQDQLLEWDSYLGALQRLNTTIQNRAEQGVAPQADVQTAISRIRQAEVGRESALLQLETSRTTLARLLSVTPRAVQWNEDSVGLIHQYSQGNLQRLVDRNPDVLIATAQIAVQHAMVREAKAPLYPDVSVQYRHYYDGIAFDNTADSPQLIVQYQLGNSYAAYQRFRSEKAKEDGARAHRDNVRREAEANLIGARTVLESSTQRFRLQKQANDSTQALVDSFLRQYQVGRRSWVEVLNAQREAHDNSIELIASHRAYILSAQQLALLSLAWDALLGTRASASSIRPTDIRIKLDQ